MPLYFSAGLNLKRRLAGQHCTIIPRLGKEKIYRIYSLYRQRNVGGEGAEGGER